MTGRYVSPTGVVWEGNVFGGGYRATAESWRVHQNDGDFFGSWHENFRSPRSGSGNYWHTRSHFADMPGRSGPHSFFDPSLRDQMILLADAPTLAQRGATVQVGDMTIGPDQAYPLRKVWPNAVQLGSNNVGTDRAYHSMFAFVDQPYPTIGRMGGTPPPSAPPRGSPLNGGYQIILGDGGQSDLAKIVTMYPE